MKIFYMNQGGGGQWGAVAYSEFSLLLIAEASGPEHFRVKSGFEEIYTGKCLPEMSIQGKPGRLINSIRDLDTLYAEVRPMVRFQLTGYSVTVVFVHLKSGNEDYATKALQTAISTLKKEQGETSPVLWVGDFNRADIEVLGQELPKFNCHFKGGGASKWDLDYVITTGTWKRAIGINQVTKCATDHNHVGLSIEIE